MSPLDLPYPGFSWSITHHIGPVTQPRALFELLKAAHAYGDDPNHRDLITEHILRAGLLTPDIRVDAGRPQVWRDYQQVLPELGLIVSTRFTLGRVRVTPVGLMLLDGLIGHSELITTQCLRYQYPNGHKQDISTELRGELERDGVSIPQTQFELDATFGVLVKPAVLILRILLELADRGLPEARISARECLAALVPVRSNHDWAPALAELIHVRRNGPPDGDRRRLRHVQEWFRLLGHSDIFDHSRGVVSLAPIAIENLAFLRDLCAYHEDPSTFWAPTGDHDGDALSWFAYYGAPDIRSQWVIPNLQDRDYIQSNYLEGLEEAEDRNEYELLQQRSAVITLQPFSPSSPSAATPPAIDPASLASGFARQQRASRLHEQIVASAAAKLEHEGYEVSMDPLSVDLLAARAESEAIIEVKTVTRRSLFPRIRLGAGQLLEYRYRRQLQTSRRPAGVLLLSSEYNFPSWLTDYFEGDIQLGLVSRGPSDTFSAHTQGELERLLAR